METHYVTVINSSIVKHVDVDIAGWMVEPLELGWIILLEFDLLLKRTVRGRQSVAKIVGV